MWRPQAEQSRQTGRQAAGATKAIPLICILLAKYNYSTTPAPSG
jgi:hypothetical protein